MRASGPLAVVLGEATEHIAERTGEGIGGLLNATFGNAAELIIAILALRVGYTPWNEGVALLVLGVPTFFIAWISEILVGSVEQAAEAVGMSSLFVGIIGWPLWVTPPSIAQR